MYTKKRCNFKHLTCVANYRAVACLTTFICLCSDSSSYQLQPGLCVFSGCCFWKPHPLLEEAGLGRASVFSIWRPHKGLPGSAPFGKLPSLKSPNMSRLNSFLILWSRMLLVNQSPVNASTAKSKHWMMSCWLFHIVNLSRNQKKVNQWRFLGISWRKECICCSVYVESVWNRARIQVVSWNAKVCLTHSYCISPPLPLLTQASHWLNDQPLRECIALRFFFSGFFHPLVKGLLVLPHLHLHSY